MSSLQSRLGASVTAVPCLLLLGLLLLSPPGAHAHGILIQPASRNWRAYLDWNYYW